MARIAARVMRSRLDVVERGEVSDAAYHSPSGVGRFISEYEWSAVDDPFVEAMSEASLLWPYAMEALRPDLGPKRHRGLPPDP